MAHALDVDEFANEKVHDRIDNLAAAQNIHVGDQDELKRLNLTRLEDKFLVAVVSVVIQMWRLLEESERPVSAPDSFQTPLPKQQP